MNLLKKLKYKFIRAPDIMSYKVRLITAWVYIVDFKIREKVNKEYKTISYFYIQTGDFRKLRSEYLKRKQDIEDLSFDEFLGKEFPAKELISKNVFNWKLKF